MEASRKGSERLLGDQRPQFLYVKMNSSSKPGSSSEKKSDKEIKVKVSESTDSVAEFINEDIVKKHMNRGKVYPQAKLYNKNGVELDWDDILYMKTADVVYLARHGEAFNYQ